MWLLPKPKFDNESELKRLFAAKWALQPSEPMQAALALGLGSGDAGYIAVTWTKDPDVIEIKNGIVQANGLNLPTKEDFALEILELGRSRSIEAKDRIAAYKLYADIQGYVKPIHVGDNIQNNVNLSENDLDKRLESKLNLLFGKDGIIGSSGREGAPN